MSTAQALADVIEQLVTEQVSEQMKVIEDRYFSESKQTRFTLQKLSDKWGCSKGHASRILKEHRVNPIGKLGKEHEYDGNQAEEAKAAHDKKMIYQEKINWKMIAMQKKQLT